MSGYRTPLARARGLGSAKHGVSHWLAERVGAVALIPLTLWTVYAVLRLSALDYYGAVEWIGHPVNATLAVLMTVVSFQHMASGVRVIIEDYVYGHVTKAAALLLNVFICGLAGALAVFSILTVARGGL